MDGCGQADSRPTRNIKDRGDTKTSASIWIQRNILRKKTIMIIINIRIIIVILVMFMVIMIIMVVIIIIMVIIIMFIIKGQSTLFTHWVYWTYGRSNHIFIDQLSLGG